MNSGEGGGQAPDTGDTQLTQLFEKEIALGRKKRTWRIVMTGILSFVLVIGIFGMFLGSLPGTTPVPETIQPQAPPGPETTQPAFTPSPDTTQPPYTDRTVSAEVLPGEINGKANPGFPYWPSGTLPYRFDPAHACSAGKTTNFLRAFKILNDKTAGLVSFVRSSEGALTISCHDSLGAHGANAWSGPWISPAGLISNATIDMYRLPPGTPECDVYPTLEMRELLHVFGFEDTSVPGNVMYPGTAGGPLSPCGELDAGIVNCLQNIYSNGKKGTACTGIPHK